MTDSYFWAIQLIGLIAELFLICSYFRKDTNHILSFHIISGVLNSIHYFLLGAFTGAIVYVLEGIRDYLYYKTDKDQVVFIVSAIIHILFSLFQAKYWYDFLTIIASLIDGYSCTLDKRRLHIGSVISYSFWIIYNVCVMSISGLIMDGLILLANIYILLFLEKSKRNC